jgi:membrane-associated PAP2 superfamily phosphatase
MNRTGLIVVGIIAAIVGVVFGLAPELDLKIARFFFDPSVNNYHLSQRIMPIRDGAMWIIAALVAPGFIAIGWKLLVPRARMLISARAAMFLVMTMALGPGLAVNLIAKDHWGRSRPHSVHQMGGKEIFVAWWDPRGECATNCSFVSGDVSGGYWTLAPAALAPAPWRPVAYAAAIAFGSAIGVMRMLLGAHFFTDVIFAGVITFLIIWLSHNLLYRWQAVRFSDEAIARTLARFALPTLFGRSAARSAHEPARLRERDGAP